jgi:hypothetical protein
MAPTVSDILLAPTLNLQPTELVMNTCAIQPSHPLSVVLLLSAALNAAPALAADKNGTADSQARYQREVAACSMAPEGTDKAACRREAGAARASQEPPGLNQDPGVFAGNALKRCEPLPQRQRLDCEARIDGDGTTSGSVAGGGVLRELVTPGIVAPMAPPAK